MKKNTHPQVNYTKINCNSCGNSFEALSTADEVDVEICSNCHPFYTGKAKIVDTENLVKKFEDRQKLVDRKKLERKNRKKRSRKQKPDAVKKQKSLTLKDMLKQNK